MNDHTKRRCGAVLALALGCLPTIMNAPLRGQEPVLPNVLLIISDDLANILGDDRPAPLKTPQIDRLRQRGVTFSRAYCQIPLCNPSRASMMTGLRADATGVYDLDRHFRDVIPDAVTLPQRFRQMGWKTGRVGKIFHYDVPRHIGTDGLDDPDSWDLVVNPKGRDVTDEPLIINPTPQRPISAALSWLAAEGTDEQQTDGMIATGAIDFLDQNRENPFFLGVGFFRPHTPFVAPRDYFNLHPLPRIEVPYVDADSWSRFPQPAIPHNILSPGYGLPRSTLIEALRAYYASVRFVDTQVGRILDALDRLNLSERTIVVFCSDHGYHLGEKGLWQKRTLFDPSARSPLVIAAPYLNAAGGVTCRRVVEYVDLYPTLIDLVGEAASPTLAGKSLVPLLRNPEASWSEMAITQVVRPIPASRPFGSPPRLVMGRSITTDRWRYIEWDGGEQGRELYDHHADPKEQFNVAEQPEHRATIEQLRETLERHANGKVPDAEINPARL